MDKAGRVVLPKALGDDLHLGAGNTLELTVRGEEVTMRPRRSAPPLQRERGVWVYRIGKPVTAKQIQLALEQTRLAVGPDAILLFLQDVTRHATVISLRPTEYLEAMKQCAQARLSGSIVYDSLFGYCAWKAKADHIYTWNVKHFSRLPMEISRPCPAAGSIKQRALS